jgi:hypothetical protein
MSHEHSPFDMVEFADISGPMIFPENLGRSIIKLILGLR